GADLALVEFAQARGDRGPGIGLVVALVWFVLRHGSCSSDRSRSTRRSCGSGSKRRAGSGQALRERGPRTEESSFPPRAATRALLPSGFTGKRTRVGLPSTAGLTLEMWKERSRATWPPCGLVRVGLSVLTRGLRLTPSKTELGNFTVTRSLSASTRVISPWAPRKLP